MATVTELVTEFKFEGSEAPLNRYNASLGKGIGLLAGFGAAAIASSAAINRWASSVLQAFDATEQLSRTTQESVEWIQQMGYVASVNGSNVAAFESSVQRLSERIGQATVTNSKEFEALGISIRDAEGNVKSVRDVMDELRQSFQGISSAEQIGIGRRLGIDPSLIQTLNLTNDQLDEYMQRAEALGVLNEEQADQAAAYNDSITTLRFGLDGLRRVIAVGLAPQMQEMAEWFTELLMENRDWIINGIQFGMEALGEFMAVIRRVTPILAGVAGIFGAMKIATLGLAGAFNALVIAAPFLLLAGAVLVLDDLIVAFRDGESVIRDFFLAFFDYDITPALQVIVEEVGKLAGVLLDVTSGFIAAVGGMFSALINVVTGDFETAWDDVKKSFMIMAETIADAFRNIFSGLFRWIADSLTGLLPDWAADLMGIEREVSQPESDPSFQPGNLATGRIERNSRVEQTVNMDIRTSDPDRAGRTAAENLQGQLDDAQYQAARGGM